MYREQQFRPHPACAAEAASARRRPGPLPRGEGEALWRIRRSWSQCMCERKLRLAMNRKTHSLIPNLLCVSGSWSQCMRERGRRLSMNGPPGRIKSSGLGRKPRPTNTVETSTGPWSSLQAFRLRVVDSRIMLAWGLETYNYESKNVDRSLPGGLAGGRIRARLRSRAKRRPNICK